MTLKPITSKEPAVPQRTQLLAAWETAAEAQLIRQFRAQLRLDGLTYKDWLTTRITSYVTSAKA